VGWYYDRNKRTTPIAVDSGIKARSKRGQFVDNWWAERWIKALEQVTDAGRLRRGRSYARKGQILSMEEKEGAIEAAVQGSRTRPYTVEIRMTALSNRKWERVIRALAERSIFTAQLLAGEMPQEIEEAFAAANVSLFPDKPSDLKTSCSCPDWANPCKHVAATHYILGEQFDVDPFLLFRLRGRSQDEIVTALRSSRSDDADAEVEVAEAPTPYAADEAPPLDTMLDDFWRLGAALEHFPTYMHEPTTPRPVLRRLGQPAFFSQSVEVVLGPIYDAASRQALDVAHADEEYTGDDMKKDQTDPEDPS
jgi:uncharacterized Zn finger protein